MLKWSICIHVRYRLYIEKTWFLCLSLLFDHQGTAEGSSLNLKTATWPRFSMFCWSLRACMHIVRDLLEHPHFRKKNPTHIFLVTHRPSYSSILFRIFSPGLASGEVLKNLFRLVVDLHCHQARCFAWNLVQSETNKFFHTCKISLGAPKADPAVPRPSVPFLNKWCTHKSVVLRRDWWKMIWKFTAKRAENILQCY